MQISGMEFSSHPADGRLRMSEDRARPMRAADGFRRQSGLIILYAFARAFPAAVPVSALLWMIARSILPVNVVFLRSGWLAGTLTMLIPLSWGIAVWLSCKWQISDRRIVIKHGIFLRHEVTIRRKAIQSCDITRTLLMSAAGAAKLSIRTADRRSDSLLLPVNYASAVSAQLLSHVPSQAHSYHATSASLWLAAAGGKGLTAFYSAAVPVLTAAQDVTGFLISDGLNVLISTRGVLYSGILILAAIWLMKVLHTRVACARMCHTVSESRFLLSMGAVTHRVCHAHTSQVSAVDTRISLPGFVFDRLSCALIFPGGHVYPYLPPVDRRRHRIETASLSPHGKRICTVRPAAASLAYASGRWFACLVVLPMVSIARRVVPSMGTTISAIALTAALFLIWRALITTISAPSAGLVQFTDCVELTGVRGLSVHTLRVFRGSVGIIRITQSPLSRWLGRCTLRITPRGSRRSTVSCIKLPPERTISVCERIS